MSVISLFIKRFREEPPKSFNERAPIASEEAFWWVNRASNKAGTAADELIGKAENDEYEERGHSLAHNMSEPCSNSNLTGKHNPRNDQEAQYLGSTSSTLINHSFDRHFNSIMHNSKGTRMELNSSMDLDTYVNHLLQQCDDLIGNFDINSINDRNILRDSIANVGNDEMDNFQPSLIEYTSKFCNDVEDLMIGSVKGIKENPTMSRPHSNSRRDLFSDSKNIYGILSTSDEKFPKESTHIDDMNVVGSLEIMEVEDKQKMARQMKVTEDIVAEYVEDDMVRILWERLRQLHDQRYFLLNI